MSPLQRHFDHSLVIVGGEENGSLQTLRSFWETCILKFVGIYASKRKMGRCTLHSIQLRGKNLGEILGHFELKGSTHFLGNL